MSNPFNLTDEQIDELEDYYRGPQLPSIKDVLERAETISIMNAKRRKLRTEQPATNKPAPELSPIEYDWPNAPKWVRWIVMGVKGIPYYISHKPSIVGEIWLLRDGSKYERANCCSEALSLAVANGTIDWKTTLRKRPAKEGL